MTTQLQSTDNWADSLTIINSNTTELDTWKLSSVVAGTNITVDNTDSINPIINSTYSAPVDSVNWQTWVVSLDAEDITLVDTDLVVVPATELQAFADGVDGALLRARGTGITSTYVSTVSVGWTTFAQPAVVGEIHSDEGYFSISYAGATGITVANLSVSSTYVYIDNTGALQQQTTIPTRQDWSRKIFTMRIGVNTSTSQIIGFEYLNNPIGHYANSIRDLYKYLIAQGIPLKVDLIITGRVADLGFDVGSGSLMEFGGTGDINNPNIISFDAVSNTSYNLMSRTALVSSETNLVKFWDNNSVILALGSTTCVAHRVYRFSSGNFAIQYGQGNYANMTLARTGANLESYVINPALKDATFMGWWLLEETATATSGTIKAEFIEYTIWIQGWSSSSLSGCLLKGNNLSDLLDASTARTNIGLNTTANQSDSTDKRFMSDSQETILDNTSWANTGDQTISDATITTTDITTNNVSTSKHWFVPKGSWVATEFLNGNGVYSTPAWGGGGVSDWFSAYVWSSASLTTSFAKVQFNTERADDGGNYDNATYTYTVPSTWWYIFTANVEIYWLTTWDNAGVSWFLNGSNIGIEQISANSRVAYSPSIIIDLTAADTMDLRVRNATASRGTISGWGASQYNFSGSKLY